ncbi:MAG TPA: hypothetical protein VD816_12825, partial [Ohtaekwangia sp.]|nr:hypothetical protein [Ohtaekwangia sp.]
MLIVWLMVAAEAAMRVVFFLITFAIHLSGIMVISGKVILKKGKEHSIQRFHPWVFSGAIQKTEGALDDGAWVEVADFRNQTLG